MVKDSGECLIFGVVMVEYYYIMVVRGDNMFENVRYLGYFDVEELYFDM